MSTTVVIAAGALAATASMPRSKTFHVQRSAQIAAPPERVFPLINDFRQWHLWSPFEKLDAEMKKTISGAAEGTGSVYEWDGNRKAGKGWMEIVESLPPRRVVVNLDFEKPFKSSNVTTFTIDGQGDSSYVTWEMEGPQSLFSRVMGLFVSMDRMIGKDFEAGLAALKAEAEKYPEDSAHRHDS